MKWRSGVGRRVLIITGVWSLLHLYLGQRLLTHTPLAIGWRIAGWAAIVLLALAPFTAFFAGRTRPGPLTSVLEWAGFLSLIHI